MEEEESETKPDPEDQQADVAILGKVVSEHRDSLFLVSA